MSVLAIIAASVASFGAGYALPQLRIMKLMIKTHQAYQVIAVVLFKGDGTPGLEPKVSEEEMLRALDYFADADEIETNFLPWPRS